MKRCGKSAPRAWQHERHGKPHREQNQIGATRGFSLRNPWISVSGSSPGLVARGGRQRPSQRNGHHARETARHTKPGLQAGWRRPPDTGRVRNFVKCDQRGADPGGSPLKAACQPNSISATSSGVVQFTVVTASGVPKQCPQAPTSKRTSKPQRLRFPNARQSESGPRRQGHGPPARSEALPRDRKAVEVAGRLRH